MVRKAAVALAAVSAILVGAGAADAQYFGRNKVHYDRLEFRLLQTEHFDIHYYAEEEEATRHAARLAERWYARFARVLGHTFATRQPLILYASHPHFSQTNLTAGSPAEGVGGFTERTKSRIAMPFAAGLGETDHVLGHEIAHAFQIDVARSVKQNAFALPGWFIEGMAEYLSIGHVTPHTAMWLRDAALHARLPTLEQLEDPKYFPYRFGHALWSFLASEYGDDVIGAVLRSRARGGVTKRLEEATGLDGHEITRRWHASVVAIAPDDPHADSLTIGKEGGRIHVSPSISPDGRYVMFLSERDRLSLDLFMADTDSGDVIRKIVSTAADPHFDSLQYIHSSGAWDRAGRRFAMTALSGGDPVLVIVNAADGERTEIRVPQVSEIYNPSWSPDGTRLVFSALKGGLSDLFIYTFEDGALRQLTADAFADLHPAWSPDGRAIAFATDRFTSDMSEMSFGSLRIGLLEIASGELRQLPGLEVAGAGETHAGKQVNPQWAPGGGAIYFVSDRDGVSNVYRSDVVTGALERVTDVAGGVSGITPASPALAVASAAGTLAYSVFTDGRYEIRVTEGCSRTAPCDPVPVDVAETAAPGPDAAALPRTGLPSTATLAELLAAPLEGLPSGAGFTTTRYDDRLQLESFAQPFLGASTGNGFGGALRASFGVTFGDLLRDRQLQAAIRAGTDIDDFAAQIAYTNRKQQWNWGFTAGFVPSRFYGARRSIARDGDLVTRETTHLRYLHQWSGFAARYNIDRARRIELGAGLRRTGFEWQTVTRVTDPEADKVLSRELDESPAGAPVFLTETQAAFVYDTAVTGPVSPVLGQRLRLDLEPAFGGLTYADVRVDARRYFMPVRPLTIAARVQHVGRYGPDAGDSRLTPLVLGLQTLVRGYDLRGFAADECGRSATECSLISELSGSRLALLNVELRAPLFGLFRGELDYGPLPIEAIAFVDAGFLWTRGSEALERDRFRSVGAGARVNIGGFVFEVAGARPFDRAAGNGWTLSFLMRPGW